MTPIVFAMAGNEAMADGICRGRGWERGAWEQRRFPDGESYVRYLGAIAGRDIVIVCSLDDPDAKLMSLYLAASVARELGAARIGLAIAYLAYMRQDKRFHEGEGVTSRHFAHLLSGIADWLVTVDPHLHRIHTLGQVYSIPTCVVRSAPSLAEWIAERVPLPVLVGPDEESEQWVAEVAALANCPYLLLHKVRSGDREVWVSLPDGDMFKERTPVLVDDIASTARTLIAAAARMREAGMQAPWCVVAHALFAGRAYQDLLDAGVAGIASTNCVTHPSNCIDMAPAIGDAVAAWASHQP